MKIGMKELLLSLACLATSISAFAGTNHSTKATSHPASIDKLPKICSENYVDVIFAGGIAGVHTRDSHMRVTSTEIDTLAQTNSYQWDDGTGKLGLGYVYYMVDGPRISDELRWFPTIEPMLNLYYSNLDVNGDIYRFNSVLLNDLRYSTTIKNTRLMLDVALAIVSQGKYSLYALLGIGEGWSRLSYRDRLGDATRISLNTDNETNVVWEWGVGASYAFNKTVNVSLEYIFTDLGRMHTSNTGTTNGIAMPQLVGANFQVTTQAFLLGLHVAIG